MTLDAPNSDAIAYLQEIKGLEREINQKETQNV